jgi:hypothetical protein
MHLKVKGQSRASHEESFQNGEKARKQGRKLGTDCFQFSYGHICCFDVFTTTVTQNYPLIALFVYMGFDFLLDN